MATFQSLSAARSRGLRASAPKTPEPHADGEMQQPSPPRPRLRLRKRNAPQATAPTQQFLASVAAADVPIPSIEEPQVLDEDMFDISQLDNSEDTAFASHLLAPGTVFSPPKTPVPDDISMLSLQRYPDWSVGSTTSSLESSPESSRPSTARSTHTSASLFSQFSLTSEDLSQCVSPDEEYAEKFGGLSSTDMGDEPMDPALPQVPRRKKAPWTRAMSQHLWSTYSLYLQDPKVTPFRMGKSGIPPHGVCIRVAREAKRSWKGSKVQQQPDSRSGSTTPTYESSQAFIQWPHTCAATRAHLTELCKANEGATNRSQQRMAHSPTPLSRLASRRKNLRLSPVRSLSIFSGSDLAMSLAVSTSDSMQPQGPLAQLTQAQLDVPSDSPLHEDAVVPGISLTRPVPEPQRPRLGSPFTARSYGPSSSNSLADSLRMTAQEQRQNNTVGPLRHLGSPAQITTSQPSTQKRSRSRQALQDTRKSKRPTLASDFWTEPILSSPARPQAELEPRTSIRRDNLLAPRTNVQELFETSAPSLGQANDQAAGEDVEPPRRPLARLGSPFSASSSSWSFPSRLSNSAGLGFGALRRPFATIHHRSESDETATRSRLANRLAYIDERLKGFRRRSPSVRRSASPS